MTTLMYGSKRNQHAKPPFQGSLLNLDLTWRIIFSCKYIMLHINGKGNLCFLLFVYKCQNQTVPCIIREKAVSVVYSVFTKSINSLLP